MQLIKRRKGHIIIENVFELILTSYLILAAIFPINTIIPGAFLKERRNETASSYSTVMYLTSELYLALT